MMGNNIWGALGELEQVNDTLVRKFEVWREITGLGPCRGCGSGMGLPANYLAGSYQWVKCKMPD